MRAWVQICQTLFLGTITGFGLHACVCVCVRNLGIIGILWIFQVCLSVLFHSRGTVYPTEVTVQRRGFCGGTDITGDVQ